MQSFYAEAFDREMGCSEREWLMWLPAAMGEVRWTLGIGAVQAQPMAASDAASLRITWSTGEPRRIGMVTLPRLLVRFVFEAMDDAQRYAFMKRFDLYMQRGGG
jgi:hypothetical protein